VTPAELASALSAAGLAMTGTEGLIYDPFSDEWRLGTDADVNYFATATRR
jgi:2-polyprenyl-3-methyl-5-hydroxy-6-metoxy-1,4-benzoquinol methylase